MSEDSDNPLTLLETMGGALTGVPEPFKKPLSKALSELLGGIFAYPAAWLNRPSSAVTDTTTARSLVAHGLAQALVEDLRRDPLAMQAVRDHYTPRDIRKGHNSLRTAGFVVEEAARQEDSGPEPSVPDEDWMNSFVRHVEDASSERLQRLFAKILVGEVAKPGAFSPATLRFVSELTQEAAKDFAAIWARGDEVSVPEDDEFARSQEGILMMARLRETGVLSPQGHTYRRRVPAEHSRAPGFLVGDERAFLKVMQDAAEGEEIALSFNVCRFTRIGREVGSLLPRPTLEPFLRALAKGKASATIKAIELVVADGEPEVLFSRG